VNKKKQKNFFTLGHGMLLGLSHTLAKRRKCFLVLLFKKEPLS